MVDEAAQQLNGVAKTAGFLRASKICIGKEAPNLALIPSMLGLSSPFTQFLMIT